MIPKPPTAAPMARSVLLRLVYRCAFATALLVTVLSARAQQPGTPDSLNPAIDGDYVMATAIQPDGKILLGGKFTSVLGQPRRNLARLNTDGTLDADFDPGPDGTVSCLVLQNDGKILIGGRFSALLPKLKPPTPRQFLARLNPDGSPDPDFDPRPNNPVFGLAVQADGKILMGGYFTTLQPDKKVERLPRAHIARILGDGTLDAAFDPAANDHVYCVALQPDGGILIGGRFTALQPDKVKPPVVRHRLARIRADGGLDEGFDPKVDGSVFCLAVQPNGQILLGGQFTSLQPNGAADPVPRRMIARANADGSLDAGFDPRASSFVNSIALQPDGKIILGGQFTLFQPGGAEKTTAQWFAARLHPDGGLDGSFAPIPNRAVNTVAIQPDGKVLLGGAFRSFSNTADPAGLPRNFFARLHSEAPKAADKPPGN